MATNLMKEKKKTGIFLNMCVMRKNSQQKILNVETFSGSMKNENIECFGFNKVGRVDGKEKTGVPVFNKDRPIDFSFTGAFVGLVNLNNVFRRTSKLRKAGQTIPEYLYEFEALAYFLSQKGIGINAEKVEAEVKDLISKGIHRIFVYKESELYGMTSKAYSELCDLTDKWVFSGEIPIPNYDTLWNQIALPYLKSEWRIATDNVQRLLNRKIIAQMKI
jgi:hypothetical protein